MIGISTEIQLLALAALIYIYDCAQLLYVNEGLLLPTNKGWKVVTGDSGFTLRGKNLLFPNLLLSHRPAFKLAWDYDKVAHECKVDWNAERAAYAVFAPLVYSMAMALFLLLPLFLFWHRTDQSLLLVLAMIYLCSIVTGITLFSTRQRFELTRGKCWSILFECLLCPPLTINIVRRISTQRKLRCSLVAGAVTLLSKEQWEALKVDLLGQIDSAILDADTATEPSLTKAKLSLQGIQKP